MKKITLVPLAILALLIFGLAVPPHSAEAGPASYRSKITHHCSHCRQPVYAFYRPVRYINQTAVYAWIANPHTCRHSSSHSQVRTSRSIVVSPRTSVTITRSYGTPTYSTRYYSTSPTTRYRSLRSSPTLRFYSSRSSSGRSNCR